MSEKRVFPVCAMLLTASVMTATGGDAAPKSPGAERRTLVVVDKERDVCVEMDRPTLESLPQIALETNTFYTDDIARFEGPLARAALDAAWGTSWRKAKTLRAVAANGYSVDVPTAHLLKYDALLALKMDGAPLTLRDKGPIWLVYPQDQHEELQASYFRSFWIWQLVKIERTKD